MLQERIFIRLLIESKLDSLSNSVGRQILSSVKKRIEFINSMSPKKSGKFMTRTIDFDDFFVNPTTGQEFPIKVLVNVMWTKEDKIPIEASWDWATNSLEVHVNIQSSTGKIKNEHFSMIQARLYDSIRHELEHSRQGTDVAMSSIEAHSEMSDDPISIVKRKNYYISDAEVPAFVTGIYNKAKKLRKTFRSVMEEDLDKIRKSMKRNNPTANLSTIYKAIGQIRSTWLNYASSRFPKAILDKKTSISIY